MLTRSDIWYDLPRGLIAQHPLPERSGSRLMVADRRTGSLTHAVFRDLPSFLSAGDLMVFNDTRVIRARLRGTRSGTGGTVEVLLLERLAPDTWKVVLKPGKQCRQGIRLDLSGGISAEVVGSPSPGRAVVRISAPGRDPAGALEESGEMPLPPYISRPPGQEDAERYQTVYASAPGAVAAPTAGLHFDPALLGALGSAGIGIAKLTLHVGPGTFEPLRNDEIDANTLEAERFSYPGTCSEAVSGARAAGKRLVAVGTTSARVLETVGPDSGPAEGETSLFIRPPYVFSMVDALVTNFHLPGSSLLCLVAAYMGLDFMKTAYSCAVRSGYRFYSYGDAMLIL
jgi:S-adenosylmethionine:tRNA ribosyltransferase-isomerase